MPRRYWRSWILPVVLLGIPVFAVLMTVPRGSGLITKEHQVDRMSGDRRIVGKAFGRTTSILADEPLWIYAYAPKDVTPDWEIWGRNNGRFGARENWRWGAIVVRVRMLGEFIEYESYPEEQRRRIAERLLQVLAESDHFPFKDALDYAMECIANSDPMPSVSDIDRCFDQTMERFDDGHDAADSDSP